MSMSGGPVSDLRDSEGNRVQVQADFRVQSIKPRERPITSCPRFPVTRKSTSFTLEALHHQMDSRQTLSRGEHIGDSSTSSCGVFSWERVHSKNCPYFHSERSDAVLETWKLAKSVSTCKQLHMA